MDAAGVGVDGNWLIDHPLNQRLLTRRVSGKPRWIFAHPATVLAIRQQAQIQPPDLG
jgi:hypothetical protein